MLEQKIMWDVGDSALSGTGMRQHFGITEVENHAENSEIGTRDYAGILGCRRSHAMLAGLE